MSIMGYLSKGYWIVCLSSVLSLLLFLLTADFNLTLDWYSQLVFGTFLDVLVIFVQLLGITLCFIGIRKNEPITFNILLNIFLILWGGFSILMAGGFYRDLLWWSSLPEVRSLILWDYLGYVAWVLKGLLWVLAGIIFTVITFIKKRTANASEDELLLSSNSQIFQGLHGKKK